MAYQRMKRRKLNRKVLFLFDKFCVGDCFYHQFSMIPVCNSLPKSYLIKQRRAQLNNICHVTPTPGKLQGAQLCFTELLKERIYYLITKNKDADWSSQPIQVTLSGDGARMTRNSSFILLSFSLLQTENHTIAILKGSETLLH